MPQRARLEEQKAERDLLKKQRTELFGEIKALRDDFAADRKELVEDARGIRSTLSATIKERREALKAQIDRIKEERLSVRKAFVEERLEAAIERFATHRERLAEKLKAASASEAIQAHLDEADAALAAAREKLLALKAYSVDDESDASAEHPRTLARELESALRSARMHLLEAIKLFKRADQ